MLLYSLISQSFKLNPLYSLLSKKILINNRWVHIGNINLLFIFNLNLIQIIWIYIIFDFVDFGNRLLLYINFLL